VAQNSSLPNSAHPAEAERLTACVSADIGLIERVLRI
jgi:hypothetical protein